ncbi:AP-4 complex accessory subunit RUSC1 [Lithobates pipiens]
MLTSRKALISNLNYVHLQHVSLGVHLSMHSEVTEDPMGQDTSLKDLPAHQHQYKDTSDTLLVDANSNDPSVPCQCCNQHSSHAETIKYSSNENLEAIMCEDYLSPDDLPLSPLSPSSPSTDSSSSSDFTLDDSPVSMYYKEYTQDDLETPDQQPDIIPLDVERGSSPPSSLDDSIDSSHPITERRRDVPENTINNNMVPEDVPFIDWSSDSSTDSNSNSFLEAQHPDPPSLGSTSIDVDDNVDPKRQLDVVEKEDVANANQTNVHRWPLDGDLLPSLSVPDEPSTQTPKKTITSFHELAQRRRKSGGPPQPKKDKSDWLIVFSPDVEQPPVNELTASAFYHGLVMPQAQPLPEGKEVTTFRELRYRNSVNKQTSQHVKAPITVVKGPQDSAAQAHPITEVPNSSYDFTNKNNHQDCTRESDERERGPQEGHNGPARGSQRADMKLPDLDTPEAPHRLWARNDHRTGTLVDSLSAMTVRMGKHCSPVSFNNIYSKKEEVPMKEKKAGVQRRGMADGGDRRGLEGGVGEPLMADGGGNFLQRDKKNLLIAIGSSVDRIISHFNGSRNLVQKTQLGDSRLSPKLGYLIVNHLCPSLFSLIGDGLKPFQKDVIIGQRRLSPWNVVEASAKSGPESFHILFYNVSRFQQLRDPQRRFNAFIFGLLNTKQLDLWISHLLQIYDQLSVFFLPLGFLPLAATSCPELREELLLTLQPLSALTFHTDLLFEHHHLPLQDPPTPRSPANQTPANSWGVPPFQHILDLGGWLAQNLTGNADREKPNESQCRSPSSGGPQPNEAASSRDSDHLPCGSSTGATTSKTKESSATWWGQLSQASRLYIPSSKDSLAFRKLRGAPDKEQSQAEPLSSGEQRLPEEAHCEGNSQKTENGRELLRRPNQSFTNPITAEDSAPRQGGEETRCRQPVRVNGGPTTPCHTPEEKGSWFGQLFGASSAPSRNLEARAVKSRRPSSWLPPNVNVLNLIHLRTPERERAAPAEPEPRPQSDCKPERSLRALCDHAASGEAQLSFRKGDILQLLGTMDEDWIRCKRGSDTGLVPVGYTSLIL